jgi:hypothetical protein
MNPQNDQTCNTALDDSIEQQNQERLLTPEYDQAAQTPVASKANGSFKINPPRRMSIDDVIKQQNQERGLTPLPLESELLLKRVKDGGYSGQFLADAFSSAYRTDAPFLHSLGGLIKLDAEGFRLFHQILHIRHISGWNDDSLYQVEQQIKAIVGGVK